MVEHFDAKRYKNTERKCASKRRKREKNGTEFGLETVLIFTQTVFTAGTERICNDVSIAAPKCENIVLNSSHMWLCPNRSISIRWICLCGKFPCDLQHNHFSAISHDQQQFSGINATPSTHFGYVIWCVRVNNKPEKKKNESHPKYCIVLVWILLIFCIFRSLDPNWRFWYETN